MEKPNEPIAPGERRLAAIVITDVVGYSARMQGREEETLALVRADFARIRRACEHYGGEVLKSTGDGLLMCFPSVVQSVACAIQVQIEFASRWSDQLQHRIGIHLGDVFREEGDVTGDGVNIAARLEALARPGTVCISQSVYDAVKGKVPLHEECLGPQHLKNISEPVTAYIITPSGNVARPDPRPVARGNRGWLFAAGIAVAAAAAAAFLMRRPAIAAKAMPPPAVQEDGAKALVAQARGLYRKLGGSRDDVALAEQISRKATEIDPTSAEAWSSLGYENYYMYLRGWEATPARLEAALSFSRRALSLERGQAEALVTVADVLDAQGGDDTRAEALYREALVADPGDDRAPLGFSHLLARTRRLPEAIAVLNDASKTNPGDALMHYECAVLSICDWDFPSAWKDVDEAIAIQSFASAWTLKAIMCANWKGDLQGMRRALDHLAPADRAEDRAVYLQMWCALMERAPDRVFEAAKLTPRDYFDDLFFRGPKGWFTGAAHAMLGQSNLAQLDYASAEGVLTSRLSGSPDNLHDRACLAITLSLEGRLAEARREIEPLESAVGEQFSPDMARWIAMYYAVLGDDHLVAGYLRRIDDPYGGYVSITPPVLRLDPWWDKVRGKPEFEALLNDPKYCPALRE
jgi:class 3 adenylate cyclase